MGDRYDLNVRGRELPVNHDKRKLPEQKPACGMRAGCPSLRSLLDVCQCPIDFSVELQPRTSEQHPGSVFTVGVALAAGSPSGAKARIFIGS
jgi:hypothetical protein